MADAYGREALSLIKLDPPRVLDPRDARLVDDTSGNFGASRLYIDSLLHKADLKSGITYGIHTSGRNETGITLGWEDIKELKQVTVAKSFMDDTLPGVAHPRTIEYHAPFLKPDREVD